MLDNLGKGRNPSYGPLATFSCLEYVLTKLEDQAVDGSFCETWSLPSGVTFRVTGRPHPDGAIAFLFEDISAEMSLTRRFNAEIELSHAALDGLDEAILLVNTSGVVAFSNDAYREMWQADPGASVAVIRAGKPYVSMPAWITARPFT